MNFLITGGAGFIGGNFLHIMTKKYPQDHFVCLDALTYAGNMETLDPILRKGSTSSSTLLPKAMSTDPSTIPEYSLKQT